MAETSITNIGADIVMESLHSKPSLALTGGNEKSPDYINHVCGLGTEVTFEEVGFTFSAL